MKVMGLKWKSRKWAENWFKFNGRSYVIEGVAGLDGHGCACASGECGIEPWQAQEERLDFSASLGAKTALY